MLPTPTQFNYHSLRAKKARLSLVLGKSSTGGGLFLAAVALALGGAGLVVLDFGAGFILVGLAAWPLLPLLWYNLELKNLPSAKGDATQIDAVLDGGMLGRLPPNPSPKQIAQAAMGVYGGQFFAARFGIGRGFVDELSSDDPADSAVIWSEALQLQQQFGKPHLDAAMVTVALVTQIPDYQQLLAHLQLDADDLQLGLAWHEHAREVILARRDRRVNDGGIGRDWAFGYTPLLNRFAINISEMTAGGTLLREVEGHQEIPAQLMRQLSGGGRQNAVLVGTMGVGKTTIVHALAEDLLHPNASVPKTLRYRQVMALDPSSLIAAARGRGDLEDLMAQLFNEAYKAKNIIIFLDDAHLFLQEGTGSVDLSNLLVQVLEGGGLRVVMAMDEQWWLRISQTNPSLTQYLNRVSVAPLNEDDTMLVLEDQMFLLEFRNQVTYMYQSLQEAYRLGSRYVQDRAMPGQAIAVLEAAAQVSEDGLVTATSVQRAVEKAYGVKVGSANTDQEREALLNLEDLIHQRMINQVRAVNVVSSALRRARAGVRNQQKPIGTFMFLGPTGVGKTELAKSLAAVYFGGEDHLVRLDLNEFSQPQDVDRLIATGVEDPHSLTAQISKQPFSVVLLDEIEKAHPNVLNTLLQLLDEGMLRDITNRPVSFRDAIIIATSNAGADRIRQYIDAGWQLEQFEEKFVDELIDSGQFRPEFLNRFDEIVVFRPLTPEELLQLVDLILSGVNRTLAPQKISVHVADDAKQILVRTGYDPRLGARPMRRAVQRSVEDIVARRMLSGQVAPGSIIEVTALDIEGVLQR